MREMMVFALLAQACGGDLVLGVGTEPTGAGGAGGGSFNGDYGGAHEATGGATGPHGAGGTGNTGGTPDPGSCSELSEAECLAHPDCAPGYASMCDCTCLGPKGYEGKGCESCEAECFGFAACVSSACTQLQVAGEPATVPFSFETVFRHPRLATAGGDGAGAILAFTSSTLTPPEIRYQGFASFGTAWSGTSLSTHASLGLNPADDLDGNSSFEIVSQGSFDFGTLSQIGSAEDCDSRPVFNHWVNQSSLTPWSVDYCTPWTPMFAAIANQTDVRLGAQHGAPGNYQLEVGCSSYTEPTLAIGTCTSEACASEPISADAIALPEGAEAKMFQVWTRGRTADSMCQDDFGENVPPRELWLEAISAAGSESMLLLTEENPIRFVKLAARSDGAWLLWQTDNPAGLGPVTKIAKLDLTGSLSGTRTLDGSYAPPENDYVPLEPAVASLRNKLVLAFQDGETFESPILTVVLLDDDGNVRSSATYADGSIWGEVRLLASPAGDQVLAAFAGQTVSAVRFDCAD